MLKKFIINIDNGVFEAKGIDDAFKILSGYFQALSTSEDYVESIFIGGVKMDIRVQEERREKED